MKSFTEFVKRHSLVIGTLHGDSQRAFTSAVLLNAAFTHTSIDFSGVFAHRIFGASANLLVFILPFFIVDLRTNGEEIGWHGYVLPRLQARHIERFGCKHRC